MNSLALTGPYAVRERDGITFIHDSPTQTVYVAESHARLFWAIALGAQPLTVLLLLDGFADGFGLIGAGLYGVSSLIAAGQFSRIRRLDAAFDQHVWAGLRRCYGVGIVILAAQLLAHMAGGGFVFIAIVVAIGGAIRLATTKAQAIATAEGKEVKSLPRIVVPFATLQERHQRLLDRCAKLEDAEERTFRADDLALVAAWEKKNTDLIERLLKAGDGLNRETWDETISAFNAAKDEIDFARGRLRALVKDAETALAAYEIDYDNLIIDRSGILEGRMAQAQLAPKTFTQKLDLSRGTGMAISKAIAGNGSWQAAAAAVVFSGIMMAVNHQKLLRQLRDLEGQVKTQAEAVRGDVGLIKSELAHRMLPQLDGLMNLIRRLEVELIGLHDAENGDDTSEAAKAKAFELACSFREAQYLLEMKAGD